LDALNRERREIEAEMRQSAFDAIDPAEVENRFALCVFEPQWHQGVVGLLAARLKDRFHRPVIAFAKGEDGALKGSGRAISGLHLRDALDLVSKRYPGLLLKFGGHATAAGVTIAERSFTEFSEAFESVAKSLLTQNDLQRIIETDGALDLPELTLDLAQQLAGHVWGQGFPEPLFEDSFEVEHQRVVGERHLKLRLRKQGNSFEAMLFAHCDPLPSRVKAAYRVQVNEYQGLESLQLTLQHWEPEVC